MKIIATDYDGTLNHNGIDDKKKNAISIWRKAGNLFGIVSGRSKFSLADVLEDKDFEYDFLICNNGAIICDKGFNVLKEFTCKGDICKNFVEYMFTLDCPFVNIDSEKAIMVRNKTQMRKEGEYTLQTMPDIVYFNQMNTQLETYEEAEKVTEIIKEKYNGLLNPLQNGNCIDITPFGIDKASGIYALLTVVGGKYEDVITVGDNVNDEAMIKEFRSYAMANGVQRIKDIANYITLGITELIEKEI